MRRLICLLRGRELCPCRRYGSGGLIEILARGEAVCSEPGFARELLFGIEQIRLVRFDFTLKYVNLLLADARVDPVASGARLIQLRVCQDECRAQLRADEFDQFVAGTHTLSRRHGRGGYQTTHFSRYLDPRAVDDGWGTLRHHRSYPH